MSEEDKSTETEATPNTQTGQLSIQRVYTKDISFEAPNSPQIFREEWNPTVDIQLANKATKLAEDVHEAVLTVTVTVRFEDKTVYLAEVHQAGIFNIQGFPPQFIEVMLGTVCPNILFPFAREAICDLVVRGGFPQLLLAPVNFESLYAQEMQRQQEQGGAGQAGQGAQQPH